MPSLVLEAHMKRLKLQGSIMLKTRCNVFNYIFITNSIKKT